MLSPKCRLAKVLTVGMLALGMLGGVTGWAATYYVSPSGDDGNPGTAESPKQTIQAAVNAAADSDTVQVAAGTYTLTSQISINSGITVKSVSGAAATIVNGGGVTRCFELDHASAVVDGFTITNGYNNNNWRAGGVLINSGGGTVKNSTISGNILDKNDSGGGVAMMAGLVSNCTIVGNTARDGGAGVSMDGGTVRNCTISDNIISGNGWGGGVRISSGTVRDSVISGNSAGWGAGVNCEGGTVSNCTISGNIGSGAQGGGGGVRISSGTVRDCMISGNSASYGGGVDNNGGTVWNCTISGNIGSGSQGGAGVNNNGGTIRNCLIMGNYSEAESCNWQSGSVVQNQNGTIESCTIVGNFGPTYVSTGPWDQQQWYSVYNQDTMKNCIVVNNTPGFGSSGSKCTYSCTTPSVSGTGNIMQDPQFVNPGSGVGSSFIPGDYQLGSYSPGINAGTNVTSWMSSAKDLAGNARIINTTVDMGAYEYTDVAPTRIAAPADVAASDGLYGDKVRVTWSSVAGATGYVVYRGNDSNNVNFSASVSVTVSPYNDTNAVPGSNYYYWVAASDANGRSTLSAGDRGYASLYGVNFDGAQVVYLDGNKHLKKIDVNGSIADVFTSTNPAIDQILFNQQGDLFIAFPQNMGGPGGQGGVVLNDGYTNIIAKATPASNTLVGVDHEISQLSWWSQISSPNIQVDAAGNAYYFGVEFSQQPGPGSQKIKLRKYINGTTNVVDLIPSDNIQIRGWYVRADGTVLMAGKTESTETDWFRKLSPDGNLKHIISPPVAPSFIATFPDDMVYVGLQSWTYGGSDYNWPGVYRLPPDLSNPQFSFPYIGNSNYYAGGGPGPNPGPQQQIFTPEYDVNAVMAGHGATFSDAFGQCNGAAIRQYVTTSENGVPSKVFVTSGQNWSGGKTLVQYYPTVEIIELAGIETVTLIEALGDKLVIAGSQGSREKLILYDPDNGAEMDLLDEDIEIYHLQTMYTGHIWFDGLKFTGNKYIAGQFTMEIVYGANGKASIRAPKFPKSAYKEVTLGEKPSAFVGVLASTTSSNVSPQTAPSAPTSLRASQGTYSNKVQLTWHTTTGATSYEVYRNTSDSSGSATKLGVAATVGYDDTTAEVGVIYYYWVKAVNAVGTSGFSASSTGWALLESNNLAADFDGDGKADPATVDGSGNWYIWFSQSGYQMGGPYPLAGGSGGTPTAADFDGDGKADPTMLDGSGNWYIWFSQSGYQMGGPYPLAGGSGGTPTAADFDGDGKADPTMVIAPGSWYFFLSSLGYTVLPAVFTIPGGVVGTPLAGDFDGDGKADPAMVAGGQWYIWFSGSGYTPIGPFQLTVTGGSPVAGDLDGDGKADPAMVDSLENWYIWFSAAGYAQGGPYLLAAP